MNKNKNKSRLIVPLVCGHCLGSITLKKTILPFMQFILKRGFLSTEVYSKMGEKMKGEEKEQER